MKIIKLIALLFILKISGAYADLLDAAIDRKLPTAWVWEVKGNDRTVYLVGDIHAFMGVKNQDLDFKLGFDVFDRASVVLSESNVSSPSAEPLNAKLSSKVGPDIWKKIEYYLSSLLETTKYSKEKKEELLRLGLKELDDQSPDMAFASLLSFSYDTYSRTVKNHKNVVPGLLVRLIKVDSLRNKDKKINYIESPTSSDDAWRSTCDSKQQSQEYMESALDFFDFDKFWNSGKSEKLQQAFWNPLSSGDDVFKVWYENYPGSDLLLKCNIIPRNVVWTPVILDYLKTKGEPVAVIVGFAHVTGKNGLLEILKSNGYSKIKRIYSISEF